MSDVTSRLTDPSKFTGAHRERFDEEGKGKGKAGREELVDYDGSTNAGVRKKVDKSTAAGSAGAAAASPASKRKPSKFGTQATKAISITVFKNGDKHDDKGTNIVINASAIKNMKQLLRKCPQPDTGAARVLVAQDLKTQVTKLERLRDKGQYIVCGAEAVKTDSVPKGFEVRERSGDGAAVDIDRIKREYPKLSQKEVKKALTTFNVYDQDGNGFIDVEETRTVLEQAGLRASTEEIEAAIADFDRNHDEKIDFYEFLGVWVKVKSGDAGKTPVMKAVSSKLCLVQ